MSALLSVKGLEKTFGQVVAARDINVDVPQGQTIGIIGANGAGKTTFVNMITGHLTPSGGTIQFEGRDITGLPSRKIMRLGIARSFQVAQVFPTFSVFENLCAATAIARSGSSVVGAALSRFVSAETSADAETALAQFQIAQFRDALASTLPQGVRKLLDIAMATAGNPRVLLLDEPTSGISLEEKFGLMDVIMGALKARGTTILFVEHDMEIVQRFADRVLAFYDGTVIADGAPARGARRRTRARVHHGNADPVEGRQTQRQQGVPCLRYPRCTSRSAPSRSSAMRNCRSASGSSPA